MRSYIGIIIIEATDSNPNGDPDNENEPRQDLETGQGLISPPAMKRKIRDYIAAKGLGKILYTKGEYIANHLKDVTEEAEAEEKDPKDLLLQQYPAIRMFGAVLASAPKGKMPQSIRGPVQFGFARSVNPVDIVEHTITRANRNKSRDTKSTTRDHVGEEQLTEMGSVKVVSHAVYVAPFSVDGHQAANTGMTEDDLQMLLDGIVRGWQMDASAIRPNVRVMRILLHESTEGEDFDMDMADMRDMLDVTVENGNVTATYKGEEVPVRGLPYADKVLRV